MVQLLVMSIKSICRYSSTWCHRENPGHGTKNARGVPLLVYMNLDVYSGFLVYFSLCCVLI